MLPWTRLSIDNLPCRGALMSHYTLGSPGWRTPSKGAPHRSYPTQRSPSYDSSERSPPVYSPKCKGVMGLSPLALRVVAGTVDTTQLYQGCGSDRAAMLSWTSFRAFERGYVAGAPIRDIPRIGSAYKPKRLLKSSAEPVKHFISFCRDNHYRCSYLGESRSTTAVRSTPITRAGGRLPCRPTNSLRLPTR